MRWLYFFICLSALAGCRVYNQNILFQTTENIINNSDTIASTLHKVEKNYVVQPNDYLEVRIFTSNGEALMQPMTPIDPNNPNQNLQLGGMQQGGMQQGGMQQGGIGGQGAQGGGASIGGGNPFPLEMPIFQVRQDGNMTLPMIGDINLTKLTLHQADSVLRIKYSAEKLYQNCFVRTRYMNKRVTVFRGQAGIMYPLRNEKVHLFELLASVGGIDNTLRASNIRIIRGDLKKPNVYVINLRTMQSIQESIAKMKPYHDLSLEPNDIVYIEPIRKTFIETVGDLSPLIQALAGIMTTAVALLLLFSK